MRDKSAASELCCRPVVPSEGSGVRIWQERPHGGDDTQQTSKAADQPRGRVLQAEDIV